MLAARFGGEPIAVALEQSRGALVFMLSKYEQLQIYPIHSRAAAQFRAALFLLDRTPQMTLGGGCLVAAARRDVCIGKYPNAGGHLAVTPMTGRTWWETRCCGTCNLLEPGTARSRMGAGGERVGAVQQRVLRASSEDLIGVVRGSALCGGGDNRMAIWMEVQILCAVVTQCRW